MRQVTASSKSVSIPTGGFGASVAPVVCSGSVGFGSIGFVSFDSVRVAGFCPADPCCMGTAALESLEVLQGFIREELADRRTYLFLARRAPTAEARQVFRAIASDEGRHARRLLAAVYLITGERYCPAICYPPLRCDGYCAALRERYHEEVCGGFNYRRASRETLDPCLQQLLLAFSQDEYRHANAMLCLLSGVM